jgi:16S rRNA G966 N2-methylase RsmD
MILEVKEPLLMALTSLSPHSSKILGSWRTLLKRYRLCGKYVTLLSGLRVAPQLRDLIFADPPYAELDAPGKVLAKLGGTQTLLAEGVIVTLQHSRRVPLPERAGRLKRYEERAYGDTLLSLYRVEEEITTS